MKSIEPPADGMDGRDSRRRFSGRERVALALGAEGKCQNCGEDLGVGWNDWRGVEAAMTLLAFADPRRAQLLYDTMRVGLAWRRESDHE